MPYTKGQAPYHDTFNANDEYSTVLFRPGVSLQNRELNELQSILKNNIKQIGDSILSDGDIIEGCQLIIPATDTIQKPCTVTSGKLYLEGMVRNLEETHLTLQGVGVEKIGVKVNQEVITEFDDDDLNDVATGFANYRQSGAHRLKETLEIVLDDETASTLFTIQDGVIVNNAASEDTSVLDKFTNTLARRTYDESGNYKVWGLNMTLKPMETQDEDYIFLSLSEGKAYIQGFEILKQAATTIPLERAIALRQVRNEPKAFTSGTSMYPLNNLPVSQITDLVATVSMTMQLTRGSIANGSDPIPEIYRPAVDIQSIIQVNTGQTFVKGQDFTLQQDTVNWGLDGNEPDAGESYNITFTYNRTMIPDVDYELKFQNNQYYINLLVDYSNSYTDTNGNTVNGIINGSTMMVDYTFMLYYIAVVTMDKVGNVRVIKGQPDIKDTVSAPNVNSQEVLVLGSILLTPNNDSVDISNFKNTRISMAELQDMVQRLYEMEYNQAITDLDTEAMSGEEPTSLKGIYTDGFVGLSKCDLNYDNISTGVKFDAAIDLDNQELTLSAPSSPNDLELRERLDLSPASSATLFTRLLTGHATETKVANQPYATHVSLINPYQVFPDRPTLAISPAVDSWINTNSITIKVDGGVVIKDTVVRASGRSSTSVLSQETKVSYATQVLESAITYMRSRTITVYGKKFGIHRGNIILLFNDNPVTFTAGANCQGENNTLKSNAAGEVNCTFTVPSNTLCGTVKVELYPEDDENFRAVANYTANGITRTTRITETTTVFRTMLRTYNSDPLAQTFQFEKDQFISSIGIYFCVRDANEDVIIQLRGVDNGYPNNTVFAEKVLKGSECLPSELGTIETLVAFDDPVYCRANTQYCFTILTESSTASVYYAQLGGRDLATNVQVLRNPYIAGMMFSSSNALTWTAHQSQNLKFNIYGNTFNTNSYAYFAEVVDVSYDRIALYAETEVPVDTELTWEYSKDSGDTWYPISLGMDIELTSLVTKVLIRAKFKSNVTVSPVVAADSLMLVGYKNETECNYISKNITTDSPYTNIKQIVDLLVPTGTNVTLYYCTDTNGAEWASAIEDVSQRKVKDANGYTQYVFEAQLASSGATNYRVRIKLSTNNTCIRPKVKNLMSILK